MRDERNISHHTEGKLFTRDFILVFLSYFTFMAAYYFLVPTLPVYLANSGSNERQVGVLVGTIGVAALVSRLFMGGALKKYSEKSAILFGAVLFALTFLAAVVLKPFWPFFVLRVFQGIAFASLHTAALAFTMSIIPPAYRGQGIAYYMLAPNLAMATAAPFGMYLANQYGFVILFLSCTGLSACSFFLSWKVSKRKTTVTHKEDTQSYSAFFIEWKIVVPAFAGFLQNFIFGALAAFVPLYALQRGVTNPGFFFTSMAVVIIAGRALGGKILDIYSKEKIIPIFIFITMIAMVVLFSSKNLFMFIFSGLLYGAGVTFFFPAAMAYAFEYSGSSSGAAVGTYMAFLDLGIALGPVFMGLIVPLTGYPMTFLCLALICLMNMGYFQFFVKRRSKTMSMV